MDDYMLALHDYKGNETKKWLVDNARERYRKKLRSFDNQVRLFHED